MKRVLISLILMLSTVMIFAMDKEYYFDNVKIMESLENGEIRLDIYYNGELYSDDLYIHIGYNGWQDIEDIKITDRKINLKISRNTARVDFCFKNGNRWDNNQGRDWGIRLYNFLSESFMKNLGDDLQKFDYIKESMQRIDSLINYIQSDQGNQENVRQLKVLKDLKKLGEKLLPEIMRYKDFEDRERIDKDFEYFVKMNENL